MAGGKADTHVRHLVTTNPNLLVPHYLMACYAYYVEDDPLLSDKLFDEMSRELLARWDDIKHWHKDLILRDDLVAGTGYAIKYPERVRAAAQALRRKFTK